MEYTNQEQYLENVINKYSNMVYRLALTRTNSKENSEDIYQEVFLKLAKKMPKFESEEVALNLAYTGTIKNDILQSIEIGFQLLKFLIKNCRNNVIIRYKLDDKKIEEIMKSEKEENDVILEILHEIGKKRGALISGGEIDEEKTANIILDDFRSGKLGEITLERL